jgi:acyl-CoA thioester hydrolase
MVQTIICNGVDLIQAHIKAAFVDAQTFRPVAIPTSMKQDMINIQTMNLKVEKL